MKKSIPWYVVANRLKKEQKVTLQKIADRLGVAKSTAGHWLTGHNPAPLKAIQEIALMLGTTEIQLLAEDPFYISDPLEREIIKNLRDVPDDQRETALQMLLGALANLRRPKDKDPQD
jgi:transcriptional regulator with XRE-family HTH domain